MNKQKGGLPISWFIFGFWAMGALNTTGIVSENSATQIVSLSHLLMAMAMAGLALNVNMVAFRKAGMKPFTACLGGTLVLIGVCYTAIQLFL
ncbi:putative sulfate exporter family transporter [Sporosarcina sp. HYO08]|uniref:putative sulfate exporter family transporter n=1 Tax=Sporosarcina sp. HYO08 TaxID=1759557 RepID=UPI00079635E9|nr:putative sulfate exporter family transporter [Sporosarcina sp. HYO08]KXH83795.1 hypothetical protein AU377_03255 [Sporosarcina sp. HYO08]